MKARIIGYYTIRENRMDFKFMTDSELANIMVNYIFRIENLLDIIERYLEGNNSVSAEKIKRTYANLKDELREDAHYIKLVRNSNGSLLYMNVFSPSIREAAYFGFSVSINSAVNQRMYSAVEEAHYKLTKYYSLEEWENLI